MRRTLISSAAFGLAALQSGCQTAQGPQPALLHEASPEAMAQVTGVLAEAVGRAHIELGPHDLTADPAIPVLPPPLGPHETNSPATPLFFELVLQDGACFLRARSSGELYALPGLDCHLPAPD